MRPSPEITVAIPFANTRQDWLQGAIRSVFAQSHQDWELLLVADGREATARAKLVQIRDPRVRVIGDEVNRGLAYRLNQVAREARGDFIARMDSDDVCAEERLDVCVQFLRANKEIAVLGSHAYVIDDKSRVLGRFREPPLAQDRAGFLTSNQFTHPTIVARRHWVVENPYREDLRRSEDKELWLRTGGRGDFHKLDSCLFFYRLSNLSVEKQAQDAWYDRQILRTHGPALVGSLRTWQLLAKSRVKQSVYRSVSRAAGPEWMLRSKVRQVSTEEIARAQTDLARALSANVPGW